MKILKLKIKSSELLFRASRDGYTSRKFHKNCDNKGSTVTIIKCPNGNIFGG